MKVAMVDYYVAQTYPDAKTAGGKEALTTCKKALDAIYQENRGTLVGLYAHLWTGKCEDELGNSDIALDFYDEVLANEQDNTGAKDKESGLEPLMAQAINFRQGVARCPKSCSSAPFCVTAQNQEKKFVTGPGVYGGGGDRRCPD